MSGRRLNPPWLMWGNSEVITFSVGASETPPEGAVDVPAPNQLSKVDYGRPETWRFLLYAQILNVQAASETEKIDLYFDLNIGIGRSNSWLNNFEHFVFDHPITVGDVIWSTSVLGPARSATATATENVVELLTAEAIQVRSHASITNFGSGSTVQIEVASYFTPNNHVRPEWFSGQFSGGEDQTL